MRQRTRVFPVDDDLVTRSLRPLRLLDGPGVERVAHGSTTQGSTVALAGSQHPVHLLDLDLLGTPLGTAGRAL